jgi:hypothetical protein
LAVARLFRPAWLLDRRGRSVRATLTSAYFFFHDNPSATFDAIGTFVHGETPT